jgi:hypothetical protein
MSQSTTIFMLPAVAMNRAVNAQPKSIYGVGAAYAVGAVVGVVLVITFVPSITRRLVRHCAFVRALPSLTARSRVSAD